MKALIFFFLFTLLNSVFADDCDFNLQIGNSTILITETTQVVPLDLSINRGGHSNSPKCHQYRIFFGKGNANSYQRKAYSLFLKSINYNLHKNINLSGILKEFGDALNSNEYLEGTSPNIYTTYTNRFYVAVPGTNDLNTPSGYYWDNVQVQIYGYNPSNGQLYFDQSATLTVFFIVQNRLSISLVDEGAPHDANATSKVMDFGTITQGEEQGVDLRVVSNSSYEVRVSSQNSGDLKGPESATIDYELRVNGAAINLAGSAQRTIGNGDQTDSAGDRYNLKVKITGATQNLPSGLYQDVVTITASAK